MSREALECQQASNSAKYALSLNTLGISLQKHWILLAKTGQKVPRILSQTAKFQSAVTSRVQSFFINPKDFERYRGVLSEYAILAP